MLADLDLLLIAVFCTADDLLPKRAENARRRITDAEVITLCIAQAMLGVRSDEQFLAVARHRLAHLFPQLPERSAFHKRRLRLSGSIEALIAEFARHSPGFSRAVRSSVAASRRAARVPAARTLLASSECSQQGASGRHTTPAA